MLGIPGSAFWISQRHKDSHLSENTGTLSFLHFMEYDCEGITVRLECPSGSHRTYPSLPSLRTQDVVKQCRTQWRTQYQHFAPTRLFQHRLRHVDEGIVYRKSGNALDLEELLRLAISTVQGGTGRG